MTAENTETQPTKATVWPHSGAHSRRNDAGSCRLSLFGRIPRVHALTSVRYDCLVPRDAPVAQPHDPLSKAGDFLFVSDQYNRMAGIVQRTEQLHDLKA